MGVQENTQAHWYSAVALFKAVHIGKARKRNLWERTVFLLRAPNAEEAVAVADRMAREQECEYVAAGGDTVHWTYQKLEGVLELLDDEMKAGTEVYWQLFERSDK